MFLNTGKYLRECREKAKITQTELQHMLGYKGSNGLVCRVESGRAMYPAKQFNLLRKLVVIEDRDLISAMCLDYSNAAYTNVAPLLKQPAQRPRSTKRVVAPCHPTKKRASAPRKNSPGT